MGFAVSVLAAIIFTARCELDFVDNAGTIDGCMHMYKHMPELQSRYVTVSRHFYGKFIAG